MSQHGGNSVHRPDMAGGKVSPGMGRLNLYYYHGDNLILLQEKKYISQLENSREGNVLATIPWPPFVLRSVNRIPL